MLQNTQKHTKKGKAESLIIQVLFSSTRMGYFREAYHDARFNFDHFIVDYKRKYYSLNQNPRVLRARVPNQPFTSLRTYEYCKTIPACVTEDLSDEEDDEYKENVPEAWIRTTDIDLFPSFDACFDQSSNEVVPRRVLSEPNMDKVAQEFLETFSLNMNVGSQTSPNGNEELIQSDNESEENAQLDSGMQYVGPFHLVYHTPQSDYIEVKKSNRLSRLVRSFSNVVSRGGEIIEPLQSALSSNPLSPGLQTMDKQEPNSNEPIPRKPPPILDQQSIQIWKMVLNDASLSAARISTGNSTSPVVTNQCIKGDFTDAKLAPSPTPTKPNDIFAQHLEQAKLKYSPKSSLI